MHSSTNLIPNFYIFTIYPVQQLNQVWNLDCKPERKQQQHDPNLISGTAALGTIVNLTAVGNLHVDIVVVASVVVNPITGARLGKGKGYGDIEYAMMRQLGACDDSTLVITTVHETQLLDDLPSSVMTEHDL